MNSFADIPSVVLHSADAPIQINSATLCVDLDGTFLRTDTLYECLLIALKSRPDVLLRVPFWLAEGRYHLKQAITERARHQADLSLYPRQSEVESLIQSARAAGKRVELISAADHRLLAETEVFRELFDTTIGSSDGINLKAHEKARLLSQRHPEGFAYVGNSADDLPVWRAASERFGVNLAPSVRRQASNEGLGIVELARPSPIMPALLRSMRLHQWLKNLLLFVPLALILPQIELSHILTYVLGFVFLGLLTSGTYLVNDLLDVDADRRHPKKCRRAIACGDLPMLHAMVASVGLIGTALAGAAFLSLPFAAVLLSYLGLTLAYSFRLKRLAIIDVLVISTLFTFRIVAGMALLNQPPSHWLLMFSIFFFTSLALMKREVEFDLMDQSGRASLKGRGYSIDDRGFVLSLGVSSGVASLVVFALFISAMTEVGVSHYASPGLLWGAMIALSYWVLRMWLLTTRGLMNDDPILFAARDRTSAILGAVVVLSAASAQVITL
jgi:4-hydroxybenzoate polyprenyltransferase/phosphoserine phosphatase